MIKLTEDQQIILNTVRRIIAKEIAPRAAELDATGAFPEYARNVFAENGLLNPLLPAKYSGVGESFFTFCLILDEIARACASSALLVLAQADGTVPILHSGSEYLKEKYLTRLADYSTTLTTLAATEPSAGSDLTSIRTKAVLGVRRSGN